MIAITVIAKTTQQSPYPRRSESRPHTHSIQTADPACTLQTLQTPQRQIIHPILHTSRNPHPPRPRPTQDCRPRTHPSYLHSPGTHHLARTPRSPYAPCIHRADPALTLHSPWTHLTDSVSTPQTWHIPQTPTSIPHTPHTPQTLLSPGTFPGLLSLTPRAPQTPCPPRPLAAETQLQPEEPPASAPPGSAGGKRRLR